MELRNMLTLLLIPTTINLLNFVPHRTFASPLIMWFHYCINTTGTYEQISLYQTNLNTVISSIVSSTHIDGGFYNSSIGEGVDQVNAIGLCRGDASSDTCLSCLNDAVYKPPEKCPTQKEAIGWYDDCMLRYSNRTIFHLMGTKPNACLFNVSNVSDGDLLNRTQAGLFLTLKDQAVRATGSLSSVPYYATGQVNATGNSMTVYGMVQCTPDLTPASCSNCLDVAVREIPACSRRYGNRGGRVLMPSCGVRYETALFFNSSKVSTPTPSRSSSTPPLPHSPPNKTPNGRNGKISTPKLAISIVPSTFAIMGIAASLYCFLNRRRNSRKKFQVEGDILTVASLQFDFGTIKTATNNFSMDNRLGQGGFGAVYKGILHDGQEVAVKRLGTNNSGQGEAEFKNEILLLAKLQHRNLVRLLGFCLAKGERLLIYEFVPNASLDNFLFDQGKHECLDWQKRTKIISGIARGILYLHEDSRLRTIHRDIKASNILLDKEMNPKIADFRLAKLFPADQTHANTSRIAGTYGYMALEYAMHGLFSVKSDVYSFGILLLEIICGRKNSGYDTEQNPISIVTLVWRNWREGTVSKIIDPTLLTMESLVSEITIYIYIALLCIQEIESERPTMSSVVVMLSTASLSLPLPSHPGFEQITMPQQQGYNYEHDQSFCRSTATKSINEDSVTDPFPR